MPHCDYDAGIANSDNINGIRIKYLTKDLHGYKRTRHKHTRTDGI